MQNYREFLGELKSGIYGRVIKEGKRIAAEIFRDDMPDVVKAYAAMRYLTDHVRYDYLWYDQGFFGVSRLPASDSTLEGALLKQVAVCAGISKAYSYLLELGGVPCHYISGQTSGGGHAWNIVKLDGKYYHVDVTWALSDTGWKDRYFLLTDEEMRQSRSWKESEFPPCLAGKYSWKGYRKDVEQYQRRAGGGVRRWAV